MAMMPPVADTIGAGAGGSMLSTFMGGFNPAMAGLSALSGLAGSPSSNSDGQTGPKSNTAWGTFNNPFVVGGAGAQIRGSGNPTQTTPTTVSPSITGPTSGARAPLIEGGTGGLVGMVAIGIAAFAVVAIARRA